MDGSCNKLQDGETIMSWWLIWCHDDWYDMMSWWLIWCNDDWYDGIYDDWYDMIWCHDDWYDDMMIDVMPWWLI
jgi:hypothetical protein